MKKIKVAVAEDERLAREELVYLLERETDVELVGTAVNGRELLELVEETAPDAVFLDIQMPELEGIQAARMLQGRDQKPFLLFTTAHEEYAVEAFGLRALDYLLKPYSPQRLKESLQRLREAVGTRRGDGADGTARTLGAAVSGSVAAGRLLVEDGERMVVLETKNLLYAEKEEKALRLVTVEGDYTVRLTLQELEDKLREQPFFRVHRSYLVNLDYVRELVPWLNGAYTLLLRGNETQVPVSRDAGKELIRLLKGG
ncbi:DNA-binding response regulator [Paenibacillus sp. J31TS4]|uniref:LytR/AlgR family response regulator transcription factor n=1 Tax=Paenibacillus sp. J31TS4 TaxID=2807195 RepID=UPI001AFFFF72|nr:LytTR family DNA-binding domain-containing protein [Paenibacillus sp. J31TS4]GIP36906.1 DNA-binding response regulator [Paenibacillus sp. J31TS4]